MAIKNIIFDMDGTLTATAQATEIAIRQMSVDFALPPVTADDIKGAMGLGGLEFHAKLFPGVPENQLAPIGNQLDILEQENVIKIGRDILFPGVSDMLTRLVEERYPIFIASTGNVAHVTTTLRATGIYDLFTAIHCDEPVKIDMVRRIMDGGNPAEWMMVGDMFKDAEAARANGIFALGAGYGYLHADNAGLFDAVMQSPGDIFSFLQGAQQ
ncbi:MAG: HAD family hydrolase [Defluviitaleaceae bacterium]|nr:HAD family hydrolase [Defluviitaleaceae bacterium]